VAIDQTALLRDVMGSIDPETIEVGQKVYALGVAELARTIINIDADGVVTEGYNPLVDADVTKFYPFGAFFLMFSPVPLVNAAGDCLCENCTIERIVDDAMLLPAASLRHSIAAAVTRTLELVDEGLL
jgi:hypothetical protein